MALGGKLYFITLQIVQDEGSTWDEVVAEVGA